MPYLSTTFYSPAGKITFHLEGQALVDLDTPTTRVTLTKENGATKEIDAVRVFVSAETSNAVYATRKQITISNADGSQTTLWKLKLFGNALDELDLIPQKNTTTPQQSPYLARFCTEYEKWGIVNPSQIDADDQTPINLNQLNRSSDGKKYKIRGAEYHKLFSRSTLERSLTCVGLDSKSDDVQSTLQVIKKQQHSDPHLRGALNEFVTCAQMGGDKDVTVKGNEDQDTQINAHEYARDLFGEICKYAAPMTSGIMARQAHRNGTVDDESFDDSEKYPSDVENTGDFSDTDKSDIETSDTDSSRMDGSSEAGSSADSTSKTPPHSPHRNSNLNNDDTPVRNKKRSEIRQLIKLHRGTKRDISEEELTAFIGIIVNNKELSQYSPTSQVVIVNEILFEWWYADHVNEPTFTSFFTRKIRENGGGLFMFVSQTLSQYPETVAANIAFNILLEWWKPGAQNTGEDFKAFYKRKIPEALQNWRNNLQKEFNNFVDGFSNLGDQERTALKQLLLPELELDSKRKKLLKKIVKTWNAIPDDSKPAEYSFECHINAQLHNRVKKITEDLDFKDGALDTILTHFIPSLQYHQVNDHSDSFFAAAGLNLGKDAREVRTSLKNTLTTGPDHEQRLLISQGYPYLSIDENKDNFSLDSDFIACLDKNSAELQNEGRSTLTNDAHIALLALTSKRPVVIISPNPNTAAKSAIIEVFRAEQKGLLTRFTIHPDASGKYKLPDGSINLIHHGNNHWDAATPQRA